jgi:hypothetical protein
MNLVFGTTPKRADPQHRHGSTVTHPRTALAESRMGAEQPVMQVIEALCTWTLVPHDHLHNNHERNSSRSSWGTRTQIDLICPPRSVCVERDATAWLSPVSSLLSRAGSSHPPVAYRVARLPVSPGQAT